MKKFKEWLAKKLHYLADRLDDDHAMVCGVGTFWIEPGKGIQVDLHGGCQVRPDPYGVQIWFRRDEYARKRETW